MRYQNIRESYQLNRLEVRTYMGKNTSFPWTTCIDEISDIDDVIDCTTSSDDDEDQLHSVSLSGIKDLEATYQCISCNKTVKPSTGQVGTCETCHRTQKLTDAKLSGRLIIHTGDSRLTLRASHDILKAIAQSDTITAHDLLFAPMFNCTYNKFHLITRQ